MQQTIPLKLFMILAIGCGVPIVSLADGPQDNLVENVRRIPKLGVEVSEADRQELAAGLSKLAETIEQIQARGKILHLLPDVMIFHRAVDQALNHQEFFDPKEIPVAKKLLQIGQQRADELLTGKYSWTRQTGLVVKGYISKIDNTVQPYGLIIPEDYDFNGEYKHRLDFWFHGRGETLSEVNFINQRLNDKGQFTPPKTIVLHPYGRYCNANKFAGEIDTFEALASAQKFYRINPERLIVRGFSMGGAACWQFAVHYPGKWFAANPGAGFSETPDFLKVFQNETLKPTWYEEKLWRMYDCTGYAANLAFLPTVAYSGEIDKQKQAADMMEQALKKEGLPLLHIIGPMTAHKIHPDSKEEIENILGRWARLGVPLDMKSPYPAKDGWEIIDQFETYTLRYNQSRLIRVLALKEHWEPARVVVKRNVNDSHIQVMTKNVTAFSIIPGHNVSPVDIVIDGDQIPFSKAQNPLTSHYILRDGHWVMSTQPTSGLTKRPGLQGPIDDAFMDRFIFVKPTSKGLSPEVDAWVKAEFEHAVEHWRRQFRGDAIVMLDTEITKEDMQSANIVLWGDLKSNETLGVLQSKLPIHWNDNHSQLQVGEQSYDAKTHLPLLIYPNPLAPNRYVVLNSSFTYREYDYLNNARQTPKLPDWAIVDIRTPPNARFPGKVVDANFFDEAWQLKAPSAR